MEEKIKKYREYLKQNCSGESSGYSPLVTMYSEMLNDLEEIYGQSKSSVVYYPQIGLYDHIN